MIFVAVHLVRFNSIKIFDVALGIVPGDTGWGGVDKCSTTERTYQLLNLTLVFCETTLDIA